MSIDKNYFNQIVRSTEKAAIGAYPHIGKGDKIAADQGSVDMMRQELNKINMNGQVVIGEGEMDEAPMLYIGEKVGTSNGQDLDIALDPLEGTNFVAKNLPNSFSMIAVCEKGKIFSAPDTYMEKLAIGQNLPDKLLDLDNSIEKNIKLLSEAKEKKINEITACLLKRPRHDHIIKSLHELDVKIKYITDGDVTGAISVIDPINNVDIYLGIGGGPEGVLAATALDAFDCFFQCRFLFDTHKDKQRAKDMGISDFSKKYYLNEITSGDSIFCATGITDGDLVNGIKIQDDEFISETLVTHKSADLKKVIKFKQKI